MAAMLLRSRSAFAVRSVLNKSSRQRDPESHQEAERRCCVEGRLAWMPNEACRAMDGPSRRPSEQRRSEGS